MRLQEQAQPLDHLRRNNNDDDDTVAGTGSAPGPHKDFNIMTQPEAHIPDWIQNFMTQQQQQMQSMQDQHRAQIQALQNAITETNMIVQSL